MPTTSQFAQMSAEQQQSIINDLNEAAAHYSDPDLTAKTLTVMNALIDYQRIINKTSLRGKIKGWIKASRSSSNR